MQHDQPTKPAQAAPRHASPFGPQYLYAFTAFRKHADHRVPLTNEEIAAIPGLKQIMRARLPATDDTEANQLSQPYRGMICSAALRAVDVELGLARDETE